MRGRVQSRDPKTGLKRLNGTVVLDPDEAAELPLFCLQQTDQKLADRLEESVRQKESELGTAIQCRFFVEGEKVVLEDVSALDCTSSARLRILKEFVEVGSLSGEQATRQLLSDDLTLTESVPLRQRRQAAKSGRLVGRGWGSRATVSSGSIATNAQSAWRLRLAGKRVILALEALTLEAKDALAACDGLLLGRKPSAALTDIPCLVVDDLRISQGEVSVGGLHLDFDQTYTIDGANGELLRGVYEVEQTPPLNHHSVFQGWLKKLTGSRVRCNLENPDDRQRLGQLSVGQVGLCRLELFFQSSERIELLLRTLGSVLDQDSKGLADFTETLSIEFQGLIETLCQFPQPVLTLRLFDTLMSEMLNLWTSHLGVSKESLHPFLRLLLLEKNSTQGLRGGRFSILYPSFLRAQLRAVARAIWRTGERVDFQVMLPGVASVEEVQFCRRHLRSVFAEESVEEPKLGMMLETPRACLLAGEFARDCEFFSFGTGDLTEATYGWSRYEAELSYLPEFRDCLGIGVSPFQELDQAGVGELMRIACVKIREVRPQAEIGWCGAQASRHIDPDFFKELTLDYVSVPLAAVNRARLFLRDLGP